MNINHQFTSTNFWTNNNPKSFMLHTTGGAGLQGAIDTLIARGLSYNYIIHKGVVYQLVDWRNSAWHAGVVRSPNMRATAFYGGALKGPDNPNRNSVGVAFTYPADDIKVLADADIDACVLLIKQVGAEAGVRYNADNIFYHQEVTIDKPIIVKGYREQVLEALVGDKDDKDTGEKARLMLLIQYLTIKIKYLLLLKALRDKNV